MAYLATESAAERIAEVDQRYTPGIIVGRFGVIRKQGQPNQWCLILDLSHLSGHSINDGVQLALSSLYYVSVDDGGHCWLRSTSSTPVIMCLSTLMIGHF